MAFGNSFSMMFSIIPFLFFIVFFIVIASFIIMAFRGAKQWKYNNNSPILDVTAKVVAKRNDVSVYRHHPNHTMHHHHSSTAYYVTFEVESGSRMEFQVSGSEYGQLAEGDFGELKFQGTRFLNFNRTLEN